MICLLFICFYSFNLLLTTNAYLGNNYLNTYNSDGFPNGMNHIDSGDMIIPKTVDFSSDDDDKYHYSGKRLIHLNEGQRTKIICEEGGIIDVISVSYRGENCVEKSKSRLLYNIKEKCGNKNDCEIEASNHLLGGDPCFGVPKVFQMTYKCSYVEFKNRIFCETDRAVLKCDNGKITITHAIYGRRNIDGPCGRGIAECYVDKQKLLGYKCNDKQECQFNVNNDFLNADPCPNYHKALIVSYRCY